MRWDSDTNKRAETPNIDKFIEEVIAVYHKHGYSIGHEDRHGGFIIHPLDEENIDWLKDASFSSAEGDIA